MSEVLDGWDKIQDIMDLIVNKKTFTSNRGRTESCKETGKLYQRKHLLLARLILKDLKRAWKVEGLKGIITFKEYYTDRKQRGKP